MIYDKKYFIEKFSAIPEGLWTTEDFADDYGSCAYGHCGCAEGSSTAEGDALEHLFRKGLEADYAAIVSEINDGGDPRYKQATPKARILAALNDLP